MIRSIFLKELLTKTVFQGITVLNKIIPKNDKIILLYSNMEFRDNIKVLYEYLIEHSYDKKYRIICCTPDYKKFREKSSKGVAFYPSRQGILFFLLARHVYYCFGKLPIVPAKNQIAIQMWHGTPFKGYDKSMRKRNKKNVTYYTYVFASSEVFRTIVSELFQVDKNRVYINGQPRTDLFYSEPEQISAQKYIIWLPTFRQSKLLGYEDTAYRELLPIFSEEEYEQLNEFLKQRGLKLLVKLHPSQDVVQDIKEYSNLTIFRHDKFLQNGMDLYRELKKSDALITDYSSVFYDYLLLDRPIAFTADDMDEYRENRGFVFENPEEWMPGPILKNKNDFYTFLEEVSQKKDLYCEKRREINKKVNSYQDGKNIERTLEISEIEC